MDSLQSVAFATISTATLGTLVMVKTQRRREMKLDVFVKSKKEKARTP
jgi:hypothetical protein